MSDTTTALATYLTGNEIDYSSLTDVGELKKHWEKNSKYPKIREIIIKRILEILPELIPAADFFQLRSFMDSYEGYDEVNQLVKPALLAVLPVVLAEASDLPTLVSYGQSLEFIMEAKEMISVRMDTALASLAGFKEVLSSYRNNDLFVSNLVERAFRKSAERKLSSISDLSLLIDYRREDTKEFKIPGTVTNRQGAFRDLIDLRIGEVVPEIYDIEILLPLYRQAPSCLPIKVRIAQVLPDSVSDMTSLPRLIMYYKIVSSRYYGDNDIKREIRVKACDLLRAKIQKALPEVLPTIFSPYPLAIYLSLIEDYDLKKIIEKRLIEVMEKSLPAISDIDLLLRYSRKTGAYCSADRVIADRLKDILARINFSFYWRSANNISVLTDYLGKAAPESLVKKAIWAKGVNTAEETGIDSLTVLWGWMHGSDIRRMMFEGATLRLAHNQSEASDLAILFEGYKRILGNSCNCEEIYDQEMRVLIRGYIIKIFSQITKNNIPEAFLDIIKKEKIPKSLENLFREKAQEIL